MLEKKLVMTVGLPRSGKSTAAAWYQEAYMERGVIVPIVCPDEIRLAIHGRRFDRQFENLVWYIAQTMVRAFFLRHDTVILDATSVTVASRAKWKSPRWKRVFLDLSEVSEKTCIARAEGDGPCEIGGREDLVPVIKWMAKLLEPILYEEQHDNEEDPKE